MTQLPQNFLLTKKSQTNTPNPNLPSISKRKLVWDKIVPCVIHVAITKFK